MPGRIYSFYASLNDGTCGSNSPLVTAKAIDVPQKSLLALSSLDTKVKVELGHSFGTTSDGFSPITKLLLNVHGEFGDASGNSLGISTRLITIDISHNGVQYTTSRTIENLLNNKQFLLQI